MTHPPPPPKRHAGRPHRATSDAVYTRRFEMRVTPAQYATLEAWAAREAARTGEAPSLARVIRQACADAGLFDPIPGIDP